MRRFLMCAVVMTVAWAGSIGYAQKMKINNLEDYKKAMQVIGAALGAANKAIQSGSMPDAKMQAGKAEESMESVVSFFEDEKKDDLKKIAKDSEDTLEALEKSLGKGDQPAVLAAFKAAGASCRACHTKYRVQDPTTKAYSFKPGSL